VQRLELVMKFMPTALGCVLLVCFVLFCFGGCAVAVGLLLLVWLVGVLRAGGAGAVGVVVAVVVVLAVAVWVPGLCWWA
jgi:hypothetical protein